MVLVVNSGGRSAFPEWQALFAEIEPSLVVKQWDDPDLDVAKVQYALVWEPTPGRLAQFPSLKVIMSSAAGVDHITRDTSVPATVPITRMVTEETVDRMADFVTASAYGIVRDFPAQREASKAGRWDGGLIGRRVSETCVTVLGLGQLGAASALRLQGNGFIVRGWSRSKKILPNVHCFSGGRAQLLESVRDADILVNLLPDTPETKRMIDAEVLRALPADASIVNVGRAAQLDTQALLHALDSGHLRYAFLDVFDTEPLAVDDPFWSHPKIWVSAHVASAAARRSKALQAARTIRAERAGLPLEHLYRADLGY